MVDPTQSTVRRQRTRALGATMSIKGAELAATAVSVASGPPPSVAVPASAPLLGAPGLAARLARFGHAAPGGEQTRYEVEGMLGLGATGRVYAVRDRDLDRAVAIKFLVRERGTDGDDEIRHFVEEAQIAASLEHPNVLPVHELDVNDAGQIYFSMKRIDGSSLGAAIEASTLAQRAEPVGDSNAIVNVIIGVCQALSYAHHRGIVHQDIKPDNIMLGAFGEVLLVDWGSAVRRNAPGEPRLYGTPLYMSPEQASSRGVDERSDIYCLGASMFHALTLRYPTWSDDPAEFWAMKRVGTIQPPTQPERVAVPTALLDIALKALAADPVRRYPSADEMLKDLRRYQAGLAISAHRDTWLESLARWHRRHWRTLWSTVAVTAVVGALAGALYGERLKEIATWGAPIVEERFEDDGWKAGWRVEQGSFERRDGGIVSTALGPATLMWTQQLSGPIAIEYDAQVLPGSRLCDISAFWCRDLSGGREQKERYQMQVGAYDGSFSAITASGGSQVAVDRFTPVIGQRYRIRAEIDGSRMSLAVDGRVLCEWHDTATFDTGYVGLFGYYPGKAFDNVKIYSRGTPQKVPATAVGDRLARHSLLDEAHDEFARVAALHPGTKLAREAVYKQGFCRWQQKRYDDALAVWAPLAGTGHGDLVRLHAIDRRFIAGDLDGVLADSETLAASAGAETRKRLATQWASYANDLRNGKNGKMMERFLDLHARFLADQGVADFAAANALQYLGRHQEVLDRYAYLRSCVVWSLNSLGRHREIVDRYADQPYAASIAAISIGEYHVIDRELLPTLHAMARLFEGHPEEALRIAPDDAAISVMCLLSLGRFEEIERNHANAHREVAMAAVHQQRRPSIELTDPRALAIVELVLGDAERAAELAPEGSMEHAAATHLVGLRAWIAGDRQRAREWFARSTPPPGDLDSRVLNHVLVAFLEELGGADRSVFARGCATLAEWRWAEQQTHWYYGRYLAGECSDAEFLAQPNRLYVQAQLLLLRAIRAERDGRPDAALADYRAFLALDTWKRGFRVQPFHGELAQWRVAVLSGG